MCEYGAGMKVEKKQFDSVLAKLLSTPPLPKSAIEPKRAHRSPVKKGKPKPPKRQGP